MKKVGILATGTAPDELIAQYGSYADMLIHLLAQADDSFVYQTFDVRDNDFPDSIEGFDAWLITGSKFNVYQKLDWMLKLEQLIVEIDAKKVPLIGICFGHQIIAEALGGKVGKYEGGWGVGIQSYTLAGATDFIDNPPATMAINAMHQDQVIEKPAKAKVFAYSDHCQYAGLVYDTPILTFQGHPEFTIPYETDLIKLRKGSAFSAELGEESLVTMESNRAKTDSGLVAHWIVDFIKSHA